MRRVVVVGVGLVVAGAVAWFLVRPGPTSARDLATTSCSSLASLLHSGGRAAGAEGRLAVDSSRQAAQKDARYRGLATAASRLTSAPAGAGIGAPALPGDLGVANRACGGKLLGATVAIATRVPYLTDVTQSSVVVNIATDRPVSPEVRYGSVGSGCQTSTATGPAGVAVHVGPRIDYLYSIELTGLEARATYCYQLGPQVFDRSTATVAPRFVTASAPGDPSPFSFAVFGDWGGGTKDEANVLKHVGSSPASFIVTTGDNAYISGNQTDYGDLSSGNVFRWDLWPQIGARLPTFAAQGNHGFSIYPPLLQNWPEPASVSSSQGSNERVTYCCTPNLAVHHRYANTWYAFDRGPARFYVLDAAWADHTGDYSGDLLAHWNGPVPGCTACGTELQWLQADLAAHAATRVKFAFFHYPLHADASDHRSDTLLGGPTGLEGLLARNGVGVVFNGHAHVYERNAPQIPGAPMVSYVTGGGGVGNGSDQLAQVQGCSSYDAYAIGASHTSCHAPVPTSDQQVYHFLLVTVRGNDVTVTPTDENGRTFDVQTYHF